MSLILFLFAKKFVPIMERRGGVPEDIKRLSQRLRAGGIYCPLFPFSFREKIYFHNGELR